ncbi:hypothetical protein M2419_002546 [Sphingobacterium sp. BIGb0116]|nr:hypothetical protein [Sphingobacterium sp. BIGb0116]
MYCSCWDESNRFFNIVSYYTSTDSMKSLAYSLDSTVGVFGWKYIGESSTYHPNRQLSKIMFYFPMIKGMVYYVLLLLYL